MKKEIEQYRPTLIPLGLFMAVIVAGIFGGKYLFNNIQSTRAKIATVKKEYSSLSERYETLKQAELSSVNELAKDGVRVLPSINEAIYVVYHIRNMASELEIVIDKLSIRPNQALVGSLQNVDITFEAAGSYENISTFLERIATLAPLTNIVSIDFRSDSQSLGEAAGDVVLKSYWSPLPENLPPVTEPISELVPAELEVLRTVATYDKPELSIPDDVVTFSARTNPFVVE